MVACSTATGHCYVMLGTIKFVDKSVNDDNTRRLDHCDFIALGSGFGVPTGVPHSEVELQTEFKSFTAAYLGSTHRLNAWRPMHLIQQVNICLSFSTIHAIPFIQVQWG